LTVDSGSVSDRSDRKITGYRRGSPSEYDGGRGICGGSWRAARAIIDCTSCAAASMSAVQRELQRDVGAALRARRVHRVEAGMVENCFSSGSATADAIVSGLAPGRLAFTAMVGKSMAGRSLTGSSRYGHHAKHHDAQND
jgi:hypothetical protein